MKFKGSVFIENVRVALGAVRSQALRSILTVVIIMFGIMALVGILTAIEAVKSKITSEFSRLGTNSFTISQKNTDFRANSDGTKAKVFPPISFEEATEFKNEFGNNGKVGISGLGSFNAVATYGSKKSNPNIRVLGVDENYLEVSGYSLAEGRNFSASESVDGLPVAILGKDVATKIFEEYDNPVDKVISIGSFKYTVVGMLQSKGNSMGFTGDNQILIPVSNVKKNFADSNTSYSLNVMIDKPNLLEIRTSEAMGLMRLVRGDSPLSEESFRITKSDAMAETMLEGIALVTIIATLIGVITLITAGIGLMNIMLVSVTERTREIGVRKALGASQRTIRTQFLLEAVVIGQIGGILGILFGTIFGNLAAFLIDAGITLPWGWMITGAILCFIVSVVSGYYPASKAARLDPIEALRHE